MSRRLLWRVPLALAVGFAVVASPEAFAKKPGGIGIDKCPRDVYCLDVWDPVVCDDGQVYSNDCYAWRACATGCESYGDGGPVFLESDQKKLSIGGSKCPRDVYCFDLWDPVVCDDGQVYSNECYAWRACATGCESYGDGGPVVLESGQKKLDIGINKCPRDVYCLDVWDPVICDDGQVYSNGCYAWRECATGCVPWGDGGPIVIESDQKKLGTGFGKCPRDVYCLDVWDPVICDDGQIYSNDCYAWRACATGCESYGDGGPVVLESGQKKLSIGGSKCPRDVYCFDLWDPVVCDDGQVYSNECYAWRECATGCVPYGDGGPIVAE